MEVGSTGGGTRLVKYDLHTCYAFLCVRDHKQMQSGSSSWCGYNQGAAADVDTIVEQQLKQTKQASCL